MRTAFRRLGRRLGARLKPAVDAVGYRLVILLLQGIRRFDRIRISDLMGRLMRWVGPWLREHRIGRENLKAAFPEKSPAEIEKILAGVWDNLGRVAAEFAHLDRIRVREPEETGPTDIDYDMPTFTRFDRMRVERKSALVFAAHLGNWELPALIAARRGADSVVLYRRPNIGAIADAVIAIRHGNMGEMIATGLDAPVKLGRALAAGRVVAMLVDQHYGKGVDVTFFGRTCKANPLIAMLARQVDCPIHGVRVIRLLDGHRFRVEVTEAIPTARDADGKVDIQGTMQAITSVVEGWVREQPEQWLWLHRRWR